MSDNPDSPENGAISTPLHPGDVTEVSPPQAPPAPVKTEAEAVATPPGGGGGGGGDGPPPANPPGTKPEAPSIAGISALKGLVLYGATLTFAGLYVYFIIEIVGASAGKPPKLDAAMVAAAAALAGVLGSAFALEIGTPPDTSKTNARLAYLIDSAQTPTDRAKVKIRQLLSLESSDTKTASWPKTFGIWVYAVIAGAVAVTYVLNQTETPSAIKALAVAFGGYVVALINNAYNSSKQAGS